MLWAAVNSAYADSTCIRAESHESGVYNFSYVYSKNGIDLTNYKTLSWTNASPWASNVYAKYTFGLTNTANSSFIASRYVESYWQCVYGCSIDISGINGIKYLKLFTETEGGGGTDCNLRNIILS